LLRTCSKAIILLLIHIVKLLKHLTVFSKISKITKIRKMIIRSNKILKILSLHKKTVLHKIRRIIQIKQSARINKRT
jgi:hypothetical protein